MLTAGAKYDEKQDVAKQRTHERSIHRVILSDSYPGDTPTLVHVIIGEKLIIIIILDEIILKCQKQTITALRCEQVKKIQE